MKQTYALLLALILLPLAPRVDALGLGNINLHSALNQPLNADIRLLSVDQEELDRIYVGLATSAAFAKAGIERPFYLTQLKFKIVIDNSGAATIRAFSKDPIREPFVNFLLEVEWPKGRLLREYTLLLDPPAFSAERAVASI